MCKTFNSQVYYKYVGFNTCDASCPLGQYIDTTKSNMCAKCDPGCVGCVNSAANCIAANGCNSGTYFYSVTSACLATCPVNYYAYLTANSATCVKCDPGCA